MSLRARLFVGAVLVVGAGLGGRTLVGLPAALAHWPTWGVLVLLATLAQLNRAEAPNHVLFYATPVFLFAGLLLLAPPLYILLVVLPHLLEWARERWRHSAHLRAWYLQPFNVAMAVIAGSAAHGVYAALDGARLAALTLPPVAVVTAAALVYLVVNHVLLGQALVLARGVSWRAAGVLDPQTNQTQLILLLMGYVVAVLWHLSPWIILPALSPLLLIYRALSIPQLEHAAQVDGKTGVFNARHFDSLYGAEFARAQRFNRPLTFIMADLDFLRDVNNTYGHLAGDAVLAAVGRIIRQSVRDYDSVGRFGGEEFAIVLPETGLLEAQMTAERIRLAIAAEHIAVATSPGPIGVTMSLGVACYPSDGTTLIDLTHAADAAVYQAKAGGRNRVVCAADRPRFRPAVQPDAAMQAITPSQAAAPDSVGPQPTRTALVDDLTGLGSHRAC